MRRSSLIMNIPSLLIFVYAYVGLSKAAPRIGSNDVPPVSGKRGSAADTWQIFRTDMPRSPPGRGISPKPSAPLMLTSTFDPAGPSPPESERLSSSSSGSATAPKMGVNAASPGQVSGQASRLTPHKRSADAKTTFFNRDKAEKQPGMMLMISQQTGSYGWAGDNTETSLASTESVQGGCLSGCFQLYIQKLILNLKKKRKAEVLQSDGPASSPHVLMRRNTATIGRFQIVCPEIFAY